MIDSMRNGIIMKLMIDREITIIEIINVGICSHDSSLKTATCIFRIKNDKFADESTINKTIMSMSGVR